MIDRLLYEKPPKQTGIDFTPVDDKYIDTTDLSLDSDENDNVNDDVNFQLNTLASVKHPNHRNTDEAFSTDILTPTTTPMPYDKLMGSIKDGQMNVYTLPLFSNDNEVQGNQGKSYATPLQSSSLNKVDGFYVKPAQSPNFHLKTPNTIGAPPLTGYSTSGTNLQQSDLIDDKELKLLLQNSLQEKNNNEHPTKWRDDDQAIGSYYDKTYNDLLSQINADVNRFSDYLKLHLGQNQDTSQDVFTNRLPLHEHEHTPKITQRINSLLGVSPAAFTQQKSVCWDGEILRNYTLVGGINAGTFTDNGKTSNMDICMQFCCKRESCDLAFMIEDDCYSVACNSNGACEPRKARPTHYFPRIAIRKKPQGEKYPTENPPMSLVNTSSNLMNSLFIEC